MKTSGTLTFAIGAIASLALSAGSIHAAQLPPEKDPLKEEILGPAMEAVKEENGGGQAPSAEEAERDKKPARNGEEDEEAKEADGDDKKLKLSDYVQFGGSIEVESARLNDFEEPWHNTIELASAELDFEFTPTDWISALFVIELVDYTRVEVKEGFATLGGTEEHPYYLREGGYLCLSALVRARLLETR